MEEFDNKTKPIGFFDSGVGGLSVYSRFRKLLPFEKTIYYGDLKNLPYGNKTKEELICFARKILNFFKSKNTKAVVIACNTSSALAYETIKNEFDFKIYPIIQSSAQIISKKNYKKIGVFATLGTVKSGAYKKELIKYNPDVIIKEIACPNWVNIVESGSIATKEACSDIDYHINEMLDFKPDAVILGCTHYPYLLNYLKNKTPQVLYIDPAEIFVDFIKNDLIHSDLLSTSSSTGSEELFVSAMPNKFVENARLFYKIQKLPLIC